MLAGPSREFNKVSVLHPGSETGGAWVIGWVGW